MLGFWGFWARAFGFGVWGGRTQNDRAGLRENSYPTRSTPTLLGPGKPTPGTPQALHESLEASGCQKGLGFRV